VILITMILMFSATRYPFDLDWLEKEN
jgi:hypothetical protein